jgi:four helix bundle protein
MAVKTYRDLVVWRKAVDLVEQVYRSTSEFPRQELYALTTQMRRAAISIPSNIAEGQGRQTTKDFLHFLAIARGSSRELETQCIIAQRLGYTNQSQTSEVLARTEETDRLIGGLSRALRDKQQRASGK